ncbi:hypothetical protein A4G18_07580 [Pasteurellaceae bacterium Pebbles2]|nr:hypothetical protein [Pasteurellaceae bacterium Pebbles2]
MMDKLVLKPRYPKPKFIQCKLASFADNHLNQAFNVLEPNTVWVGDITYTYIYTQQGWLYLAVVIDLFSRKIIGWNCSEQPNTALCEHASKTALKCRKPADGLLFYSDRGVQYSSHIFRQCLAEFNIIHSQSRAGKCTDNAVMEYFFRSLKAEKLNGKRYRTQTEAMLDIAEYIEDFYNPKRLHSTTLGYRSLITFEWEQCRLMT